MTQPISFRYPEYMADFQSPKRHNVLYGGRGSAKSYSVAQRMVQDVYIHGCRVLCAREYQSSMQESVYALIKECIVNAGLEWFFTFTKTEIIGLNDGAFHFVGINRNPQAVKSKHNYTRCWVEEARDISRKSMDILIPSIRGKDSEIWWTFNPELESDPVYQDFVLKPDENTLVKKVNYYDNPFFPEVLELERQAKLKKDPVLYRHVWEGECLSFTDAQVFHGCWKVDSFTPSSDWGEPLYGLDFGFSQDPTAMVKVYVHNDTLFIHKDAGKVGLELDDTVEHIKRYIPEMVDAPIYADSARPESISYLKRHGLPRIQGVSKSKGSGTKGYVEQGIQFMRNMDIIIHPSCSDTIREFTTYSHKIDKRTGDILKDIEDKNNHWVDATRYALNKLVLKKQTSYFDIIERMSA